MNFFEKRRLRKRQIADAQAVAATRARIDGKAVKYVTRRTPEGEIVLGKAGRINCGETYITVLCNGKEVFRAPTADTVCGELLSLDGVVLEAPSETVVAYYQYYRK